MSALNDQTVYRLEGGTYSHFGLFVLHMSCLLTMALGIFQISQLVAVVLLVNNIVCHLESSDSDGRSDRMKLSRSKIKAQSSQVGKLYSKRWVPSDYNANAGVICSGCSWSDDSAQCLTMLG